MSNQSGVDVLLSLTQYSSYSPWLLVMPHIFMSVGITCPLLVVMPLMKVWSKISVKIDSFSSSLMAFCLFILISLMWSDSIWLLDVFISFLPFLTSYSEPSLVIFLIFYSISIFIRLEFCILQILDIQVLRGIFIQVGLNSRGSFLPFP